MFNEDSLRAEIVKTWGEHGAHVEVFDGIMKVIAEATYEMSEARAEIARHHKDFRRVAHLCDMSLFYKGSFVGSGEEHYRGVLQAIRNIVG